MVFYGRLGEGSVGEGKANGVAMRVSRDVGGVEEAKIILGCPRGDVVPAPFQPASVP